MVNGQAGEEGLPKWMDDRPHERLIWGSVDLHSALRESPLFWKDLFMSPSQAADARASGAILTPSRVFVILLAIAAVAVAIPELRARNAQNDS